MRIAKINEPVLVQPHICDCLLASEALEVLCEFSRQRQVARIETLDLIDARSRVLGEIEDVDLAVAEVDPHANRDVACGALGSRDGVPAWKRTAERRFCGLLFQDPPRRSDQG